MDNPKINRNGNKHWYDGNHELHRDNDPAVILADSYQAWYQHGLRHRANGPAVEFASGTKLWYLHDIRLSFDKWLNKVDISDEDKVMMKLQYG
jgi:hypothetical protein|tara:strand:+ start:82 stop:360 length:279 start_codon:yes stop_codon:yes gene_type:complete